MSSESPGPTEEETALPGGPLVSQTHTDPHLRLEREAGLLQGGATS